MAEFYVGDHVWVVQTNPPGRWLSVVARRVVPPQPSALAVFYYLELTREQEIHHLRGPYTSGELRHVSAVELLGGLAGD